MRLSAVSISLCLSCFSHAYHRDKADSVIFCNSSRELHKHWLPSPLETLPQRVAYIIT